MIQDATARLIPSVLEVIARFHNAAYPVKQAAGIVQSPVRVRGTALADHMNR